MPKKKRRPCQKLKFPTNDELLQPSTSMEKEMAPQIYKSEPSLDAAKDDKNNFDTSIGQMESLKIKDVFGSPSLNKSGKRNRRRGSAKNKQKTYKSPTPTIDSISDADLMLNIDKTLNQMIHYQKFDPECKIETDGVKQKKKLRKERKRKRYLTLEAKDKLKALEDEWLNAHRRCELAEMMNYIYKMLSDFRDDLYMKTFTQFENHNIPPIITKKADTENIFKDNILGNEVKSFECQFRNGLNFIDFTDTKDLQAAWIALRQRGIPFFFFDPRDPKYFKVVVKGIPARVHTKEVFDYLAKTFPVQYVHRMTRGVDKIPLPFVLVQLLRSKDEGVIYCIDNILGFSVTVEPLKRSEYPTQCFKCQGFFHAARWCRSVPRCVKCGENHLSVACVNPNKRECANCGGKHTANYKQCPVYAAQKERLKHICINRVPTHVYTSRDFYIP